MLTRVFWTVNGKTKKEISLSKLLTNDITFRQVTEIYRWLLDPKRWLKTLSGRGEQSGHLPMDTPVDPFHVNTIEIIRREVNGIFKNGNLLVCSKRLNLIGVIDPQTERLVWSWGKDYLVHPHHPTLLDSGNLLIFDNGSRKRRPYSRIIELSPVTNKIVWKYEAVPREAFFTTWGGANQRLANGNTLVTDSESGRVFEIDGEGEVVWEFYNPEKADNGDRATIYRMMRIVDPDRVAMIEGMMGEKNQLRMKGRAQ